MFCTMAYLYFIGLLLNGRFGFTSELRQTCDRFIFAALTEEEVWRFRHKNKADEEYYRYDGTENPKDCVTNKRPNSVGI